MASETQRTHNVLAISGQEKDVKAFLEMARSEPGYGKKQMISFAVFVPLPTEMISTNHIMENGNTLIENWCYENWGTLHDAENVFFEDSARSPVDDWAAYTICFDTSTAPLPVIEAISSRFPTLDITYSWEYMNQAVHHPQYDKFCIVGNIYSFKMRGNKKQTMTYSLIDDRTI